MLTVIKAHKVREGGGYKVWGGKRCGKKVIC